MEHDLNVEIWCLFNKGQGICGSIFRGTEESEDTFSDNLGYSLSKAESGGVSTS